MDFQLAPKPTVIVVDDDAALLGALQFALELDGFDVRSHRCGSTIEVDDLPATGAVLVIDYHLPKSHGLDVLARLRGAGVTLPAILITTHVNEPLRNAAAALDASIVAKPLLGSELLAEINAKMPVHLANRGGNA